MFKSSNQNANLRKFGIVDEEHHHAKHKNDKMRCKLKAL